MPTAVASAGRRPDVPGRKAIAAFAAEVGPVAAGKVTVAGGRTQWGVGGAVDGEAREVHAPAGIVEYEPAEMVVRVGAGTTVAELDAALAVAGQMVTFDAADPTAATVGGCLAVGQSGIRRLRWGPLRDVLLEVHFVTAEGGVARAGGPVVKNVTGFDLCRLLVGSLGTLGFLGQVVLRTQPRPAVSQWLLLRGAEPAAVLRRVYRPSSVLWDGTDVWVLLEGHADDVAEQLARLRGAQEAAAPPALPSGGRLSMPPGDALALAPGAFGGFVAEIGVGLVHTADGAGPVTLGQGPAAVARRLKAAFDPTGRLNPGRRVG